LNKYTITYAHAAKLLLTNKPDNQQEQQIPFAGFAPSFEGQELAARSCFGSQARLGQLAFNQTELEEIAPFFDGLIQLGEEATRKSFLNITSNAEILHLSTHACLDKDNPMDSRIFFANQQYLTTAEIYPLNIQAKMAVLSACQTGLGQVYNGEGVISLARAFAQAGCPSVTMSLWPVADEATAKIMVNYYKHLDNGINKSQALRQAKLDFLDDQPKAKQHPYYWAAFVHLGDYSEIQESGLSATMFWTLVIGGVLILGLFLLKSR